MKSEEARNGFPSRSSGGTMALPAPYFERLDSRTVREHFRCFKPPSCGNL